MTTNGTMNGWLKLLGAITGLILSMLALFFTMIKPAVNSAVADQIKVESLQRAESFRANDIQHKNLEERVEKRLDRIEGKLDHLIERGNR
ncbi:MAG: hypothetical protein MUO35_06595 [Anaerolineales bacterium]|nr:hypothetical protein [Anaerolineales bacterium]